MQRRAANIDGYAFHAETFGGPANPPVLVVHGGPGGDYRLLLGLQALADQYADNLWTLSESGGRNGVTTPMEIGSIELTTQRRTPLAGRQRRRKAH